MISTSVFEAYAQLCESVYTAKAVTEALENAGLGRSAFEPPPMFVPYRLQAQFAENLARATGERHFAALVSRAVPYEALGPYAQYVLAAENLEGAITRGIEALPTIITGVTIDCSSNSDIVELKLNTRLGGVIGRNHVEEGFTQTLINLVRLYTKPDWVPNAVGLIDCVNGHHGNLEQIFETNIYRSENSSSIIFSSAILEEKIKHKKFKDNFFVKEDVFVPDLNGCEKWTDIVSACINAAIRNGNISLDVVSEMIGIGPRTLQRLLMSESESFQSCLDTVRRQRATQLLVQTSLSIDSIAQHLGFAEPNSFRRAFRTWFSMSPKQYRKAFAET
jgi:AraC-like DNA-binding protein